jgi:3',5'-cyclic AMP phosphodiesterase CpdA
MKHMFTLAHLTDPHLAPLPRPLVSELASKRLLGYFNWLRSRKAIHSRKVLDAIVADMLSHAPDHIAVGGDLVNLSLSREFKAARTWLETLGSPDTVSVIPGNHDAYVNVKMRDGLGLWKPYMRTRAGRSRKLAASPNGFPTVRQFGKIALIGLSTAIPTPPFGAWGRIDTGQLKALERILTALGEDGSFRIVMIHHPPLPGLTGWRRGLREAAHLKELLVSLGAELVLYGHNHVHAINILPGRSGTVPVIGAPSASSCRGGASQLARYNLFRIWHEHGRWRCEMTGRGLRTPDGPVTELEKRLITG